MADFHALIPVRTNSKPEQPATREDFFAPFVTFRREMDRMFDHLFGSGYLADVDIDLQSAVAFMGFLLSMSFLFAIVLL